MSVLELLEFLLALALVFGLGRVYVVRGAAWGGGSILTAGLVLRVVGAVGYFVLHEVVYGGGDYNRYLTQGALAIAPLDSSADPYSIAAGYGGRWWGTPFVSIVTSWLMAIFGTGALTIFVLFAGISFAAAACFVSALRRAFPDVDPTTYAAWVMLFPSLWFWSSPLGKDGLILLGVGLTFLGVVSRDRWQYLALGVLGIALTLATRPQFAVVLMVAMVGGVLLGRARAGGQIGKLVSFAVLSAAAIYIVTVSSDLLGFEVTEASETTEWIERRGGGTAYGGSAFSAATNPASGLVNSLFRPFLWESSSLLILISSLELTVLWLLLLRRRRASFAFIRTRWRSEAVWISVLFVVVLGAAAGMAVGNFGTLVRQRVTLYPFLFLLLASAPRATVQTRAR